MKTTGSSTSNNSNNTNNNNNNNNSDKTTNNDKTNSSSTTTTINSTPPTKSKNIHEVSSQEIKCLQSTTTNDSEKFMVLLNNSKLRAHFRAYLKETLAVENLDVCIIINNNN